jgi:hypothetical protein
MALLSKGLTRAVGMGAVARGRSRHAISVSIARFRAVTAA